jgi:hypothetical protein
MIDQNPTSLLDFLRDWMKAIHEVPVNMEPFKQDITFVQGKGRYYNLIHHGKRRIAKKNLNRAKSKKGLPGVNVSLLKGCYPTDVDMEV